MDPIAAKYIGAGIGNAPQHAGRHHTHNANKLAGIAIH